MLVVGVLPMPSLCRSLAASSWCQGVQLGASPSMMETMLRMMRLPLSVCWMTACLSDSAKSVWALCSWVGWSSVEIICSDYRRRMCGLSRGDSSRYCRQVLVSDSTLLLMRLHPHPNLPPSRGKGLNDLPQQVSAIPPQEEDDTRSQSGTCFTNAIYPCHFE